MILDSQRPSDYPFYQHVLSSCICLDRFLLQIQRLARAYQSFSCTDSCEQPGAEAGDAEAGRAEGNGGTLAEPVETVAEANKRDAEEIQFNVETCSGHWICDPGPVFGEGGFPVGDEVRRHDL
jgi:hypothetical protein